MKPALQLSLQMPDGRHRAQLPRHKVARWIRAALATPAEIAVRVVGEDEGRALNRDYRGKDYATNVLTFDYAREPVVHADLVLCAPVVEREAREQCKTPAARMFTLGAVTGTLAFPADPGEAGGTPDPLARHPSPAPRSILIKVRSVVPPPISTMATPRSRSSWLNTASLDASGWSTMSTTSRPARFTLLMMFCAEVTAPVITWTFTSSRFPDSPSGSRTPS